MVRTIRVDLYFKNFWDVLFTVVIENLVRAYKIIPEWLLTGNGPIYKDTIPESNNTIPKYSHQNTGSEKENKPDPGLSNLTEVISEHQDMIKRFKNPEKAKEFNEFLIEIEGDDPEGYDELYKEARSIFKTIKRLKKTSGEWKSKTGTEGK